jgi:hypothetical protein
MMDLAAKLTVFYNEIGNQKCTNWGFILSLDIINATNINKFENKLDNIRYFS